MNARSDAADTLPRSPLLMSAADTALLVVDVQEKLMPLIDGGPRVIWNIRRLLDATRALQVPVAATEQYPQGLGGTVSPLADYFDSFPDKVAFSCGACGDVFRRFRDAGISKILVAGIEAHVCVQQTVHDLLADGLAAYVAVDAVGARFSIDLEVALRRMDSAGAILTTTEAAMFELCETAENPAFKPISKLVQEVPP
ncbi:MAG: isochorismatase family protein [Planctomycetota bacterium]|nr:MAG: isochorismatase family protein [Planctomycetota bacterium]REK29969.1 MAG: isochorismatase family protein [Planctomycetota bacterium]REK48017.1 MAG: isochorismatase family protein [Planctomycetota bacterium]